MASDGLRRPPVASDGPFPRHRNALELVERERTRSSELAASVEELATAQKAGEQRCQSLDESLRATTEQLQQRQRELSQERERRERLQADNEKWCVCGLPARRASLGRRRQRLPGSGGVAGPRAA